MCVCVCVPVLTIVPMLSEVLQVRPSAVTARMYVSPQGSCVMSHPVPSVVQKVVSPSVRSRVAVYISAPTLGVQDTLTVWFSQPTLVCVSWGGQGAGGDGRDGGQRFSEVHIQYTQVVQPNTVKNAKMPTKYKCH